MWKHVKHAKKQCTTLHSILITLHSVEEHWIEEFKQANDKTKTKTRRRTKYVVWEKITVKCHQIHFPFIRSFTGTCNNKFWPTSDRKENVLRCSNWTNKYEPIASALPSIIIYQLWVAYVPNCWIELEKEKMDILGMNFKKIWKRFWIPSRRFSIKSFSQNGHRIRFAMNYLMCTSGEYANRMQHLQSLNYNYKSISDLFQNPAYNANITRI